MQGPSLYARRSTSLTRPTQRYFIRSWLDRPKVQLMERPVIILEGLARLPCIEATLVMTRQSLCLAYRPVRMPTCRSEALWLA